VLGQRKAIIKELYVGVIGWTWIAALVASVYSAVTAAAFAGSWWRFFACAVTTWVLYQVSLYYVLETEHKQQPGLETQQLTVHFDNGTVEEISLFPGNIGSWVDKVQREGKLIEAICDEYGYVIWAEKDGSRIF
jgi:hypothetical protein